jgi:hypothetical protein
VLALDDTGLGPLSVPKKAKQPSDRQKHANLVAAGESALDRGRVLHRLECGLSLRLCLSIPAPEGVVLRNAESRELNSEIAPENTFLVCTFCGLYSAPKTAGL